VFFGKLVERIANHLLMVALVEFAIRFAPKEAPTFGVWVIPAGFLAAIFPTTAFRVPIPFLVLPKSFAYFFGQGLFPHRWMRRGRSVRTRTSSRALSIGGRSRNVKKKIDREAT
jgi:hypothetical protein